MNKVVKIMSMLMMVIMLCSFAIPTFAVSPDDVKVGEVNGTNGILDVAGRLLGLLQWVAIIGGVIIIAVLGVKYMMGSLEEKADYKKSMIPLIVGIVVVMGATSIANLLVNTFKIS